jgi:hypothetical protein
MSNLSERLEQTGVELRVVSESKCVNGRSEKRPLARLWRPTPFLLPISLLPSQALILQLALQRCDEAATRIATCMMSISLVHARCRNALEALKCRQRLEMPAYKRFGLPSVRSKSAGTRLEPGEVSKSFSPAMRPCHIFVQPPGFILLMWPCASDLFALDMTVKGMSTCDSC